MKFYALLFLIFALKLPSIFAQELTEADSLTGILPKLKGEQKIHALNRLTWILRTSDLENAQKYGDQAIELAEAQEKWELLATAYNYTGVVLRNRGNLMYSLNYFYRALNVAEKRNLVLQTAYAYTNIGNVQGKQNKNEEAIENINQAVRFFRKANDKRGEAYGWIRLGEIYQNQEKYDDALKSYLKCLEIRKKEKLPDNKTGLGAVKSKIGQVYLIQKNYQWALFYFRQAVFLSQEINELTGLAINGLYVAKVYKALQKMDSVFYYAEQSLRLAQEVGMTSTIQESTEFLAEIYEEQGDYHKAYELTRLYSEAQAHLIREKNAKTLQSIQIEYQVKKQDSKIELLEKDKFLSRFLLGSLVIALFLSVFWVRYMRKMNRQRKEDYKLLKAQKHEIEAQTENLMRANDAIAVQKEDLEIKHESLEKTLNDLENAQIQVAESEKMASLGQMLAGISNELNNPLNFIYTGTESLQSILEDLKEILDKYDETELSVQHLEAFQAEIKHLKHELEYAEIQEDIVNLLADIYDGAKHTNRIVAGLRTFTQAGKKASSVDIHQNLEATLIVLNHKRGESVEIIQNYDKKLPYVTCFPSLMNQVFMSLVSYSMESVGESGRIEISTERTENEMVIIRFSDTGKGMNPQTLRYLFEPLHSSQEINMMENISFALTADIIQKHQGEIKVESQEGKGTSFEIRLPIYPQFK